MARYSTTVETPLEPAEAFNYMADVTNFPSWDPGIKRSVLVQGLGRDVGSAYDVNASRGVGRCTSRNVLARHDGGAPVATAPPQFASRRRPRSALASN